MTALAAVPAVPDLDIVFTSTSGNFDAWRSQVAPLFDCTRLNTHSPEERGSTRSWRVNSLVFSEAEYSAMANERKKRHLHDTSQFVFLYRFVEGSNWLQVNGAALRQSPGSLIFLDYAHEYSGVHTDARTQGVFIPHEQLGLRPGDLNGFKQIRAGTTLAHLLIRELDSIFAILKSGQPTISPQHIERLCGCMQFAIGAEETKLSARAQHREALFDLIRQFIEQNLDSPGLNTALILKTFGVSRAGLYRMFDAYGGVRSYISERRIIRAALDLARAANERGQVSRTADRWGFSSDANFVRAMNARFGATPGALFHSPILPAATPGDPSALLQARASLRSDMNALSEIV